MSALSLSLELADWRRQQASGMHSLGPLISIISHLPEVQFHSPMKLPLPADSQETAGRPPARYGKSNNTLHDFCDYMEQSGSFETWKEEGRALSPLLGMAFFPRRLARMEHKRGALSTHLEINFHPLLPFLLPFEVFRELGLWIQFCAIWLTFFPLLSRIIGRKRMLTAVLTTLV